VSKKSVIEYYEAVVSPLLTYASEIKPDISMTKKMMETTEARTLDWGSIPVRGKLFFSSP
jgi:hypothetical protein